jgi:Domain of unknown function (DUF4185)
MSDRTDPETFGLPSIAESRLVWVSRLVSPAAALLLCSSLAAQAPDPVSVTIPVVLDVFGRPPTHYTSDLVLVNRGAAATRVSLAYRPAPGTPGAGAPSIGDTLPAGRDLRIPDVIQYLRAHGVPLPASGSSIVGSLGITFLDVTDPSLVFAGSRTSTPNPDMAVGGSFGLFSPAIAGGTVAPGPITIFGLREDALFRSNLALVDLPGGSGPSSVAIQLYDGDAGTAAGEPIPYTLLPGDFHQLDSVLALRGVRNGWATITRTGGGTDPFFAYAVVNDGPSTGGGTSDGSFLAPGASDGLIPIVLHVPSSGTIYTSELILANPTAATVTATITYTPSAQLAAGAPVTATIPVPAGRQLRFDDLISYLGTTLHLPIPQAASQGGTLLVGGGVAVLVRTSNPNPDASVGGTFGLAYPASPIAARASAEAWVYGLRQEDTARSNIAIADARVGDPAVVSYAIDLYDSVAGNGSPVKTLGPFPLTGGQWAQVSSALAQAGLSNGYARVHPQNGTSDYVAYGVVNDGMAPGHGTSDGSYVGGQVGPVSLTYVSGSSVKVEQILGDCDWPDLEQRKICTPTASQTISRYDIEGIDLGSSFEAPEGLIFLFGDTIGTKTNYHAADTFASSTSTDPASGLLLNFFTASGGGPLLVQPPGVAMGPDDVPAAGISLNDVDWIVCSTGSDTSLPNPHVHDSSVLVRFDPAAKTFTTGRSLSALPGGHFINMALHAFGSDVLIFGLGDYRATDVYLASVPASSFESGAGTRYFAGLVNGAPTWTDQESGAVPLVIDNPLGHTPPDAPTIGNVSVTWSRDLGLWLMTYDGGRQTPATAGVYFAYSPVPWGPWSPPQLIFNAKRDHALGVFIHDPSIVPDDQLDGPTIAPANNPPATTRGGVYAPFQIERFTRIAGRTLTIDFTVSTWNPYTVVRMRSAFQISNGP